MSRTLSEIDAIIEAEVERRCADRVRGYSAELRAMADRMAYEEFGARPEQMTNGIEIVPPKWADNQPSIEVEPAAVPSAEMEAPPKAAGVVPDFKAAAGESAAALEVLAEGIRKTPTLPAKVPRVPTAEPALKQDKEPVSRGQFAAPKERPDWLDPALETCRATKDREILFRLAAKGSVTLQEVIYHFSPPMKETYALNVISSVRRALKAVGWDLVRDAEGAYRARIDA